MKVRSIIRKDVWKNKKIRSLILLAVFVILYKPPIVEAIGKLFRSTFYAVRDVRSFQMKLDTPYSGENVLPTPVQEMLSLLRTHHLKDYRVSEPIRDAENGLIYQRVVESAWPTRINPSSKNKFAFISESDVTTGCTEQERKKEIALVFCN